MSSEVRAPTTTESRAEWNPPRVRRMKDALKALLALPWEACFTVLGSMRARRPPRWRSEGGQRVLVVAPHPDDEVYGCGGTLLLHREAGDHRTVAVVTDGRRSRAVGLGPEAMAERRRREAREAAEVLDVERLELLGLEEGAWDEEEAEEALSVLVRELRPDILYVPSRLDFHPEHRAVAQVLARVLESTSIGTGASGAAPVVRVYAIQVPLTVVLVNLVAPVERVRDTLRVALERYASQTGSLRTCLRQKRYAGRRFRAGSTAETFWQLPVEGYGRLHRTPEIEPGGAPGESPFRGLRPLPFTDPLAYLAGRRERRRLASLAAGLSRTGTVGP